MDLGVIQIARSGLNLEALYVWYVDSPKIVRPWRVESLKQLGSYMSNLKTLECSNCFNFRDRDLAKIATLLPWLEELNISNWKRISDKGVEVLSSKLRNLSKINISHYSKLTDKSLLSLSSNCLFLKEIVAEGCSIGITQNCIAYLFRHSPNLISLSVDEINMDSNSSPAYSSFTIANSITYAKSLCALEISFTEISDSLLISIAKAHLPLKKLALDFCSHFTVSGLSILVQACHYSLQELNLGGLQLLTDEYMNDLCHYLHNLTNINLRLCLKITSSTLFFLIRNCPLLQVIEMQNTGIGNREEDFDFDIGLGMNQNHRIISLCLANNNLNNKLLKKIGVSCPNLQVLDVGYCPFITDKGIEEIFKSCKQNRNLRIGSHIKRKFFRTHSELFKLKLEVLKVAGLKIDGHRMEIITKRCPELRYLNLDHGSKVMKEGWKKEVNNCRKFKQIFYLGNVLDTDPVNCCF